MSSGPAWGTEHDLVSNVFLSPLASETLLPGRWRPSLHMSNWAQGPFSWVSRVLDFLVYQDHPASPVGHEAHL